MSCEHEHHSHSHSHGDGDDHVPPVPTNPVQSLRKYIDMYKLTGLSVKQKNEHLRQVFRTQEDRFKVAGAIESDVDAQMILHIPFTGNVRLYSIILRTHGSAAHCPKTIKLFKNRDDIDFDNVSHSEPSYQLTQPQLGTLVEFDDDEVAVESDENEDSFVEHHLPRSTFQSVTSLTIFVENNWEDDEDELTKIYYIELRGAFTSPLTRDPIIAIYEAAATPTDHKNLLAQESSHTSNV